MIFPWIGEYTAKGRALHITHAAALAMAVLVAGAAPGVCEECPFVRVFGEYARIDPDMRAKVLAAPAGKRHYVDTDGDGKPDEVWFIDTHPRHPEEYRPLLARVIDEDGDLEWGHEPDLDNDLYIADWKADGTVDAALDYTGRGGGLSEMGMYFIGSGANYFPGRPLRVWWGRNLDGGGPLWHDVGYTYDQTLCQYRTHFGGEEVFVAFALNEEGNRWVPFFENPFLFYDHDGDGVTEEVLRLSGIGRQVESMRHSFDADNDGSGEQPRAFDASVTAWAPGSASRPEPNRRGRSDLVFPERFANSTALRGIETGPWLAHGSAREFVKSAAWQRVMLTWDEIGLNMDGQNDYTDFQERWEGVIAHGNEWFPQVGGPSCGPYNKRYESIAEGPAKVEMYYLPADGRIHLKNARRAWLELDTDFDRTPDARYAMLDMDMDGYIDRYQFDADMDGQPDSEWDLDDSAAADLDWNWAEINAVANSSILEWENRLAALSETLRAALERAAPAEWEALEDRTPDWRELNHLPAIAADRLNAAREARRLRNELRTDFALAALRRLDPDDAFWRGFGALRGSGDLRGMANAIRQRYSVPVGLKTGTPAAAVTQSPRGRAMQTGPGAAAWEAEGVRYEFDNGSFRFAARRFQYPDPSIGPGENPGPGESGEYGIGGLILYVNQTPYPLFGGGTRWRFEGFMGGGVPVLAAGPVGPSGAPLEVRLRGFAHGSRSRLRLGFKAAGGPEGDELALGIVLSPMPQESFLLDTGAGCAGAWGVPSADMGWTGVGIAWPPGIGARVAESAGPRRIVLDVNRDEWVEWALRCDWLEGRRFARSPSAADWLDELREMAPAVPFGAKGG